MPSRRLRVAVAWLWDDPPRLVAHRGAPRVATENTLASFRAAVEGGARAIELDVHLARDGVPVVHHDPALGRVTKGRGLLDEKDAAELRALGIPTLGDVLGAIPREVLLDVELKGDLGNSGELPARVLAAVDAADARDRVLATSFDPELAHAYATLARRPGGAIVPFPVSPEDLAELPDLPFVMMADDAILPEVVAPLVAAGRRVVAWTVNDAARARRLLAMGCAGVITDDAARLARELAAAPPASSTSGPPPRTDKR
jgi:glycerophosphoryl diester phosphodiesterase